MADGDGGVAIELIEDDGPHGPDTGGGLARQIAREMGVARRRLDPGVAKEFLYHESPSPSARAREANECLRS